MAQRYGIKEVFNTVQGEGLRMGARSVFVRFTGCNLWDGHPLHRDQGAGPCALWCDTDFFKGVPLELDDLLGLMQQEWPARNGGFPKPPRGERWCVLTGGEPALQIDAELVEGLHDAGWMIALETNGTLPNPMLSACDHICLSPKRETVWLSIGAVTPVDEIKVILPGAGAGQQGWTDDELDEIEAWSYEQPDVALFVQPQDQLLAETFLTLLTGAGSKEARLDEARSFYQRSLEACMRQIMRRPQWRLSLQTHKMIGMP